MDAKFASLDCRYIGHLRKLPSRIGILNLLVTIFAKHQPYYILISLGPFINSFPVSIINVISFTYIWLMLITYSQASAITLFLYLHLKGYSLYSLVRNILIIASDSRYGLIHAMYLRMYTQYRYLSHWYLTKITLCSGSFQLFPVTL